MFTFLVNVFTDSLGILFGLFVVFPIGLFIFVYLPYSIISKVFNVGFKTRHGSGYIDSSSLDEVVELGKNLTSKATHEVSQVNERLKNIKLVIKEDKMSSQIDKLTKLGELRRQNIISEEEFQDLKKDILS